MAQVNLKSVYKPNLDEFISQCEINYCLIVKLFPFLSKSKYEKLDKTSGDNQNNRIEDRVDSRIELNNKEFSQSKQDKAIVGLELIELSSYTTTLKLKFKAPSKIVKEDLNLLVRLYHDAKMLEVMDGLSASKLSAIRAVENISLNKNKSIDDKRQMNQFLGECLKVCLSQSLLEMDDKN